MCIPESYQEDFEECPEMFALEWPTDIEPEDDEELPSRSDFLYSF